MRIAFFVGDFPALSKTFIINQITGLMSRGHEVDIYGYHPDEISKMHSDVEKYQILARTHYVPTIPKNYFWRFLKGVILVFANFYQAPLVLLRSLNFFKYGRQAASLNLLYGTIPLLKSQPYDIIHCQFGMYGNAGMIFREIGAIKGKLITSFRGYDISLYIKQYGEHLYDKLFSRGDFFIANCNFFRQRAIALGCDERKIIVLGSGIDCERFRYQARHLETNSTIRITTIGRLIEKKGIEYGIRAIAKLALIHPSIEYNIVGDGDLKEELQQLIQKLNITDKVKLLGSKNQQEIIEILDKSHIFIAPCVTGFDGNQDAPVNTLKEAMAMGLPVISTFHGGIPELVQDGISGFLVPERDVDALTQKLSYLIEHPEWEKMGKAGRAYVEAHYEINKLNDELVEIYQQVAMSSQILGSGGGDLSASCDQFTCVS